MIPLQDTQSQASIPTRPPPEVSNWWPTGCIRFIKVFYLVCTQLLLNLLAAHFSFFFNGWDSILKFWVFSLLAKSEEVNIMVKIRRLSRSSLLLPMGGYFPVSHSLYSSFLSVRPNIHLLCSSGSWMHLILLPLTLSNVSEGKQGSWKSKSPSFNSFLCRRAWNFMFPYRHPCKTTEGPQPSLWGASLPPTELNWRTRSTSCRKPGSAYTGLSWPRPFLHMRLAEPPSQFRSLGWWLV